jgi:hypothetical protein
MCCCLLLLLYKTQISEDTELSVCLSGWLSVCLREGNGLRVFWNVALREIYGVTGDWRKVRHEKLRDVSCSSNIK